MIADKIVFEDVTLLITHYNRSSSLERLLKAFADLNIQFSEIIVSDDCSASAHLDILKSFVDKFHIKLVTTPKNGGLANNLNKGQRAVKTPFTLYVQEDFIPQTSFIDHFKDSLRIMIEEPDLDIARYYAYNSYPYLNPYKAGFSKMIYKPWFMDKNKIYQYSDHPHLRRNTFFDRFGIYNEGIKSDKAEYEMSISFIQNKGKGIFYNDYKGLFIQENSAEEPSTVKRSSWRQSDNPILSFVRLIYRQIKYNYDLHVNTKFKR